jgi:hypothetical protein
VCAFRYGSYNYRGFDIANHLCEGGWATDTKWEAYPPIEAQRSFCRFYLLAEGRLENCHQSAEQEPSKADVEALLAEVQLFLNAPHWYWGYWGVLQMKFSKNDFDYTAYTQARFDGCEY